MRKRVFLAAAWAAVLFSMASPGKSGAGVNINIGINAPLPVVVISEPPAMVVIPGTYVYFAPDVDVDIVFYQGYWYRPHRGGWYRANDYNGPWVVIAVERVPRALIDLPPGYRKIPPGHERIPYGQVKKHWKEWEREKRWAKHEAREEWKEHKHKGKGKHDR